MFKQFLTVQYVCLNEVNECTQDNKGRGVRAFPQKSPYVCQSTVNLAGLDFSFCKSLIFVSASNKLLSNGKAVGLFFFCFFPLFCFFLIFSLFYKTSSNWEGVGKPFVLTKGWIQKRISANIEKQCQIGARCLAEKQ